MSELQKYINYRVIFGVKLNIDNFSDSPGEQSLELLFSSISSLLASLGLDISSPSFNDVLRRLRYFYLKKSKSLSIFSSID